MFSYVTSSVLFLDNEFKILSPPDIDKSNYSVNDEQGGGDDTPYSNNFIHII